MLTRLIKNDMIVAVEETRGELMNQWLMWIDFIVGWVILIILILMFMRGRK